MTKIDVSQLKKLAQLREQLAEVSEEMVYRQVELGNNVEKFRKNEEERLGIANITAEYKHINGDIIELEQLISNAALEEYAESKEKHPVNCVNIRINTELVYRQDAAIAWAEQRGFTHLIERKLKVRDFEKLVRTLREQDVTTAPFLEIKEKPSVVIDKYLGSYLEEDDEPTAS